MKPLFAFLIFIISFYLIAEDAAARGGFSSGGRGGFSSSRSYSSPSRSYNYGKAYSPPGRTTTVTRTTTVNRSYYRGGYYGYGYGYHPMMYGGFGMGFGYSNGLIEGLIIGNLMHPSGTTVYTGGGYSGNALLYPNGMVVDQNGMQVGTYQNGQFTAIQNGQFVAQQAPANAMQQMQGQQGQAQPVVINSEPNNWEILGIVVIALLVIFIFIVLLD